MEYTHAAHRRFWPLFLAHESRIASAVLCLDDDAASALLLEELEVLAMRLGWSAGSAQRINDRLPVLTSAERRATLIRLTAGLSADCDIPVEAELLVRAL